MNLFLHTSRYIQLDCLKDLKIFEFGHFSMCPQKSDYVLFSCVLVRVCERISAFEYWMFIQISLNHIFVTNFKIYACTYERTSLDIPFFHFTQGKNLYRLVFSYIFESDPFLTLSLKRSMHLFNIRMSRKVIG